MMDGERSTHGPHTAFYDIGMLNAQNLNVPGNLATQMFPYAKRVGVLLHSNSWGSVANAYSGNSRQIDEYSYENQDFPGVWQPRRSGDRQELRMIEFNNMGLILTKVIE